MITCLTSVISCVVLRYPLAGRAMLGVRRHALMASSAPELVSRSFHVFWLVVVPTALYFGVDSVGCLLTYSDEVCSARLNANWAASIQFAVAGIFSVFLSSKTFGVGLTIESVRRMEVCWPERLAIVCGTIASIIALFKFASRETLKSTNSADAWSAFAFALCWALAASAIAVRLTYIQNVHKTTCGEVPVRIQKLPRLWHYITIGITLLFFIVPALLAELAGEEALEGASAGISFMVLVAHYLMMSTDGRHLSAAFQAFHCLLHLGGELLVMTSSRRVFASWQASTFHCFVEVAFYVSLIGLGTRARPELRQWDADETSANAFRWLFVKGGLLMGLFMHFESMSCTMDPEVVAYDGDCGPWILANKAIAIQVSLSAAVTIFISDAHCTMSHILRGHAPSHIKRTVAMMMVNSWLSGVLFAGREWTGDRQATFYRWVYDAVLLGWVATLYVAWYGHTQWRARCCQKRDRRSLTRGSLHSGNDEDGLFGAAGGRSFAVV